MTNEQRLFEAARQVIEHFSVGNIEISRKCAGVDWANAVAAKSALMRAIDSYETPMQEPFK